MNILPLPAGPFFCADDGRYLPGLTDLIVQAAALLQRREIEQELLKLRLKQKCFVALAERAPGATVVTSRKATLKFFPMAPSEERRPGLQRSQDNTFKKGRW